MKCDKCLNARKIISENGLYSVCCLPEKVAVDCLMEKKDQRVIIPRVVIDYGKESEVQDADSN